MPIYEYKCTKCGAIQEELVFGRSSERIKCRKCRAKGKSALKIMSPPGPTWKFMDTKSK